MYKPSHKMYYILDPTGQPTPVEDALEWARWWETHQNERVIYQDTFQDEEGREVLVSTVFLGLDHNFGGGPKPVLWETMIFGGQYDEFQCRYTSVENARFYHNLILHCVQHGLEPPEIPYE